MACGFVLVRPPPPQLVAEVPVEVGADRGRARRRLAVLAPVVELAARDVVRGAVGVDEEDEPDLAGVHDVRDARRPCRSRRRASAGCGASSRRPCARRRGCRRRRGPRARSRRCATLSEILAAHSSATLVALADREALRRCPGARSATASDVGGDLGVRVVALVALGELARGERRRRREQRHEEEGDDEGGRRDCGACSPWCPRPHGACPTQGGPPVRTGQRRPGRTSGPAPP